MLIYLYYMKINFWVMQSKIIYHSKLRYLEIRHIRKRWQFMNAHFV